MKKEKLYPKEGQVLQHKERATIMFLIERRYTVGEEETPFAQTRALGLGNKVPFSFFLPNWDREWQIMDDSEAGLHILADQD